MIITDKAQIKVASFKESDKLHLTTSDELECYELIELDFDDKVRITTQGQIICNELIEI